MKKQGSIIVLFIWLIFFWPGAIIYWFNRVWSKETLTINIKSQEEIDANKIVIKEAKMKSIKKTTSKGVE